MKITLLEVSNYRRVENVQIAPGDRSMILIGGRNRQGKSSVLGAISAALGGKAEVADEPVRSGADAAEIRVVLDDGELTVTRRFSGERTVLEVASKDGRLKSPQAVLDRVVGTRFLDPLRFSRLKPKEQREELLKVVDVGIDLDAHAAERQKVYGQRTEANREVKRLRAVLDQTPEVDVPDETDLDAVLERVDELAEQDRKRLAMEAEERRLADRVESVEDQLEEARARVAELEKELAGAQHKLQGAKMAPLPDDPSEELQALREKIVENKRLGEARANALAQNDLRAQVERDLASAESEVKQLDQTLKDLDSRKSEALGAAAMPVDGLEVGDQHLRYRGVPLSQASGAEQLQVSLALAAAMSPELRDIWVEDGALLDEDSLQAMEKFAAENDLRIWLERVGEGDSGAIILEDGTIKGAREAS